VSATVTVSGADTIPSVQLFGGTRAAVTFDQASPFIFSYRIQADDEGEIEFAASVKDQAGNQAVTVERDTSTTAGESHTMVKSVRAECTCTYDALHAHGDACVSRYNSASD